MQTGVVGAAAAPQAASVRVWQVTSRDEALGQGLCSEPLDLPEKLQRSLAALMAQVFCPFGEHFVGDAYDALIK